MISAFMRSRVAGSGSGVKRACARVAGHRHMFDRVSTRALPGIDKKCVGAYGEAHLRKKDPNAVIDGSWPLRPVGGAE